MPWPDRAHEKLVLAAGPGKWRAPAVLPSACRVLGWKPACSRAENRVGSWKHPVWIAFSFFFNSLEDFFKFAFPLV